MKLTNKQKEYLTIAGLAAAAYYFIIKPAVTSFGEAINVIPDKEEKEEKEKSKALTEGAAKINNALNPNMWRELNKKNEVFILTAKDADRYAQTIYKGLNVFSNENEEAIFNVFRNLRYKTQVSYLADIFQRYYNMALVDALKNGIRRRDLIEVEFWRGLNNAELATIYNIINQLPDGIKK